MATSAAAFTLIELLTVLAIMGVLSAIVMGTGRRVAELGKTARAKAELAAIAAGLEGYKRQCGDYPRTADAAVLLQSLIGKLGPTQKPIGGRVQVDLAILSTVDARDPFAHTGTLLADPWGRPYVYVYKVGPWTNPAPVLYSLGPDGRDRAALKAGGYPDASAGENADNLYATQ